jgi:hypothetical protein
VVETVVGGGEREGGFSLGASDARRAEAKAITVSLEKRIFAGKQVDRNQRRRM